MNRIGAEQYNQDGNIRFVYFHQIESAHSQEEVLRLHAWLGGRTTLYVKGYTGISVEDYEAWLSCEMQLENEPAFI